MACLSGMRSQRGAEKATTEPGIRDPPQLLEFMERGFISGLCKDTKVRTNVLMCAELRWDNATDESVFLIVLRVLYEAAR